MACSGDVQVVEQMFVVEAVPEHGPEVEQPVAVEACHGGTGSSETTTMKEESVMTMLQEQHDTALEPDHHEDSSAAPPEEQAAEVSASDEQPEEEEKPPVEKEEAGEHKAPAGDNDHQDSTRERLKRHRQEVAGRVWVPEKWDQEKLLKDWVDCAVFDRPLVPAGLLTARRALVAESCTRRRPDRTSTTTVSSAGSSPLRVRNGCS